MSARGTVLLWNTSCPGMTSLRNSSIDTQTDRVTVFVTVCGAQPPTAEDDGSQRPEHVVMESVLTERQNQQKYIRKKRLFFVFKPSYLSVVSVEHGKIYIYSITDQ